MTVQELRNFLEHKDPSAEVVVIRAFSTGSGGWESTGDDMPVLFAEDSDEIRLIVEETS